METLQFTPPVLAALRAALPAVAAETGAAVLAEVPGYSALGGALGAPIDDAVEMALRGFLRVASGSRGSDPSAPLQPALDAARALGRGEAREGRSMDALLAAYRVGARVAWREQARVAVAAGLSAAPLAQFAELVFAYIDELSAASVLGHAEEAASSDRERRRALDQLTRRLLAGDPADLLQAAADRAGWPPPATLCAALLPADRVRGLRALVDPRSLVVTDDLPGVETGDETAVVLVPVVGTADRARLARALAGRHSVLGPARPWTHVRASYTRALDARRLPRTDPADVLDTETRLAELVLGADPDALADLRKQVLAPLSELRPATAAKLADTLRAWLLHQGRRDDVAAALFVHPQTVRYRMGQLRDVYGDRLEDPSVVLAATLALGVPGGPAPHR